MLFTREVGGANQTYGSSSRTQYAGPMGHNDDPVIEEVNLLCVYSLVCAVNYHLGECCSLIKGLY